MTISQLARAAGVSAETVRYYQRIGLLGKPKRPARGFRSYDPDDVRRLSFVRRAQTLGFTLSEIAALLDLTSSDCRRAEALAAERLASVKSKIADLRRLESALKRTIRNCESRQPHSGCPLIEALLAHTSATQAPIVTATDVSSSSSS